LKVLFVCSGNICRSPMAAEYFRHRASRSGLSHVVVESAGTLRIEGQTASPEAIEVMGELGVDLTQHRSSGLDAERLKTTDVLIVMTHDHMEHAVHRLHGAPDERFLLRAFEQRPQPAPDPPDLADPIGEPVEFYREQAKLLVQCVDHLVLYLKHRG